ncbi:hypothetical protein UPYG_G00209700 [Umbra pygmaea]|uniref:Uncharacterized protein n=1 Tax=Umbra pygmaea TaxID=75934 RepID=A0ABD0WPJ0_UMBPY
MRNIPDVSCPSCFSRTRASRLFSASCGRVLKGRGISSIVEVSFKGSDDIGWCQWWKFLDRYPMAQTCHFC